MCQPFGSKKIFGQNIGSIWVYTSDLPFFYFATNIVHLSCALVVLSFVPAFNIRKPVASTGARKKKLESNITAYRWTTYFVKRRERWWIILEKLKGKINFREDKEEVKFGMPLNKRYRMFLLFCMNYRVRIINLFWIKCTIYVSL